MGTIFCTVNSDQTLTVTSISGAELSTTWARLKEASFKISGGGTFDFDFTVPHSDFLFSTSDPIDWGPNGQPSWITVGSGVTAEALTLHADSTAVGLSVFTIHNAAIEGESVVITLQSTGGSNGPGGTIGVYVGDDQSVMIGPLPLGATATGSEVEFGFRDPDENELVLSPSGQTVINGVDWDPSQPSFINVTPAFAPATITIDNTFQNTVISAFTIDTNFGSIDPTIVTNPDESGPQTPP